MAASLEFLKDKINLESHQIIMLMSLAGDFKISQVVDPEMTVRFTFPKELMDITEF